MGVSRPSIARQLEQVLGGSWQAIRSGFGYRYLSTDGREVRRYAESHLGWDGYSDTEFNLVYFDQDGNRVLVGELFHVP